MDYEFLRTPPKAIKHTSKRYSGSDVDVSVGQLYHECEGEPDFFKVPLMVAKEVVYAMKLREHEFTTLVIECKGMKSQIVPHHNFTQTHLIITHFPCLRIKTLSL